MRISSNITKSRKSRNMRINFSFTKPWLSRFTPFATTFRRSPFSRGWPSLLYLICDPRWVLCVHEQEAYPFPGSPCRRSDDVCRTGRTSPGKPPISLSVKKPYRNTNFDVAHNGFSLVDLGFLLNRFRIPIFARHISPPPPLPGIGLHDLQELQLPSGTPAVNSTLPARALAMEKHTSRSHHQGMSRLIW